MSIVDTQAWKRLQQHQSTWPRRPCASCSPRTKGALNASRCVSEICSRLLEEPNHQRDHAAFARPGARRRRGRHARQMFAGEPINLTEGRAVLHVAPAQSLAATHSGAGQDVMPECARPWTTCASSASRCAAAPGPAFGQAHPRGGQHRHRRLGSRAGHGVRGAAALSPR